MIKTLQDTWQRLTFDQSYKFFLLILNVNTILDGDIWGILWQKSYQSQVITFCPHFSRGNVALFSFSWEHEMQSISVNGNILLFEETEDNLKIVQ